jgi:hypothetical protein
LNGNVVCNVTGSQSAIDATTDGINNGIIITWKDGRTVNNHIYSQMMNGSGIAVWASNGILLSNALYPQVNPNIVGVGNNEAVVTWQDSLSGNWDCLAQKINTTGLQLWNNNGVCVSSAASNQTSPKNVSNGNGGCIFAFQDKRNGNSDIYAHQIKSNGTATSIINDEVESSISIFPNPSSGNFYINTDEEFKHSYQLIIYNAIGEIVFQKNIWAGSRNQAIESNLGKGMYFIAINNLSAKTQFNSKLIINE